MQEYQVIARQFRPKTFKEVYGQEAIVTTLKNAISKNRLSQAYLFSGSRGTGKTTLARLLAKALNCQALNADFEPCNQCSSCKEIAHGNSLDVIEIDGASHRGIEDVRQINEAVCLISSAKYKIYIIDEVHMLTKEAFNALLKTLEEPPPNVKFFFATTEPHKVIPTILSRCQRFNLSRISPALIVKKLHAIAREMNIEIDNAALYLLAQRADGALRDAESLLDQIISFAEGPITAKTVTDVLGLVDQELYFELDISGKEGNFAKAFEIAHKVFMEGKEFSFFIDGLINHLRQILLVKLSGIDTLSHFHSEEIRQKILKSASIYSKEQCLDLIEYLLNMQHQLRQGAPNQISLEIILLHVMRSHFRLTMEQLVRRLNELEQSLARKEIDVDPTPSAQDLGKREKPKMPSTPMPQKKEPVAQKASTIKPIAASPVVPANNPEPQKTLRPKHELDTLMHFAAVELEGKLQKF